ncbi:thiamine transporter 2-like isoform X1 [Amphiura filiformis]|uniref:thiamine transporter 2-like isoform X1 n=1 Tax=Amphiura filiformis TaxID=82378 RepID=UPI003B2280EC
MKNHFDNIDALKVYKMAPKEWLIPSILLCVFGFFKESLPSEPFLTPYLVQYKNISEEAVTNQIYPIWTYSYMAALIPVFLFTDFLRYKPIIVLEGCAILATYALLLWAFSIRLMQLMQMFYALATASEIAYYSYIYAAVSPEHYKQVSSYTRTAVLMGNFIAGTLGQLLYSLSTSEDILFTLHVLSMTSVAIATAISLFLPKAATSRYFHRDELGDEKVHGNGIHHESIKMVDGIHQNLEGSFPSSPKQIPINEEKIQMVEEVHHTHSQDNESEDKKESVSFPNKSTLHVSTEVKSTPRINEHDDKDIDSQNCCAKKLKTWKSDLRLLIFDFKMCYSNKQLVKWSLWWAFATCGAHQVSNYIQTLWQVFFSQSDETHVDIIYNGAVQAVSTLVSALAAFSIMFTKLNWSVFGEVSIGIVSVMQSVLLVTMSITDSIWLCYMFYVVFHASYQLVKTIATYQIAKHLTVQRYGLVFGCNTFIAAVLQSILTLIVVDYHTLNASPEEQFLIYGGCFCVLGCIFCCKAVYTMTINGWRWSWVNRYEGLPSKCDDDNQKTTL